jgi:cardiolipin synthase
VENHHAARGHRHPSDRSGDRGHQGGWIVYIGLGFFWAAAIVTLYTGYDYFRAGIKQLVDDH